MRIPIRDGLRLFVDVDGAGLRPHDDVMRDVPTLILLHGGPGFDHSAFKTFFSRMRACAQIVYYDHRGMGRSDCGARADWTLDVWAEDLADLLEALGIEQPIVLGQSFGGFVALRYAVERSDTLAGLVLSSTSARQVPEECFEMFERLGGDAARDAAVAFFDDPTDATFEPYRRICFPLYNTTPQDPRVSARQRFSPEVLFSFWRGEHRRFDLRSRMADIRCPTLVVCGEQDPITPVPRSREMHDAMDPDVVRLEVVANAGHGVYRDVPDLFEDMLTGFVGSLAASEAPVG